MADEKMTRDMAEKEFLSWCEENDIETDTGFMTDANLTTFESSKKEFIRFMCKGTLIVDGMNLEYTVSRFSPEGMAGEKIIIKRPSGNIWLALDGKKDTERMHKMQNAISALIGKDVGWISKLDSKDWNFFMLMASLFLA